MKSKNHIEPPSKKQTQLQSLDCEIDALSKKFLRAEKRYRGQFREIQELKTYRRALNDASKTFGVDRQDLEAAYKENRHALAVKFNESVRSKEDIKLSFGLSAAMSVVTFMPILVGQGAEIFIAAAPGAFAAFMALCGLKKIRDHHLLTKEVRKNALEYKQNAQLPPPK